MKDNKQPDLIALCSVLVAISILVIGLRCWSIKAQPNRKFGWDDGLAVATLPFIVVQNVVIIYAVTLGLGKHSTSVSTSSLSAAPTLVFIVAMVNAGGITLPKLSALFFYFRIFKRTHRWFYITLWMVGAFCVSVMITSWMLTIFLCNPVKDVFSANPQGHCIPQWKTFLGTAIPSTIIDLVILIMPLPLLARLQVSLRKKLLLTGVFICGYCVIIVSIGRLVSIAKVGSHIEEDITWNIVKYTEWLQCEAPISVVSVSLPTCFALFQQMFEKRFKKSGSGNSPSKRRKASSSGNKTKSSHQDFYPLKNMSSHSNTRQPLHAEVPAMPSEPPTALMSSVPDHIESAPSQTDQHNVHVRRDVDVYADRRFSQEDPDTYIGVAR